MLKGAILILQFASADIGFPTSFRVVTEQMMLYHPFFAASVFRIRISMAEPPGIMQDS